MNAYISINLSKPRYRETAVDVVCKLKAEKYFNLIFSDDDAELFDEKSDLTIEDADLIISIGGDGTLLQAGKFALSYDIPIVGINAGRAGKLCKFTIHEILNCKENPFCKLDISERDVLTLVYKRKKFTAINDFIFASRNAGYSIATGITSKYHNISYHASGTIISTTTGSTAYNAAACGCLLDPQLPVSIISPICACGEDDHSYVISNREIITVSNMRKDDPTDIYCDGVFVGTLEEDLTIKKGSRKLKLVI